MVEVESRWVLQELFVDPSFKGEVGKGELFLKVSSKGKKEGETIEVITEISGSIVEKSFQIANLRFVSLTKVKPNRKRKETVIKEVERERVRELLNIIPFYLIKSGIVLGRVEVEL
ncbi:hypothetical protein [Thermovibrio sp.]